ncbi:MAG TPA: leucine-rich repeat domain-containing protein [Thiotrichales bacterium]|nr:leucine-rich repeat domain-containing protein [Thiotrichales bacterium]
MTDSLFERHRTLMHDKPRVMFSCDEDWTPGVVQKLNQLTEFEIHFDSKFYFNPAFKQCHDLKTLKLVLEQRSRVRFAWLLNAHHQGSQADSRIFTDFLPAQLASSRCIESISLTLTNVDEKAQIWQSLKVNSMAYVDLSLIDCELEALPEEVYQLKNLRRLRIDGAPDINHLSDQLGEMTQLQELVIRETSIRHLPESLGNLKQLRELDVSRNRLIDLPEGLIQLTRLTTLDMSFNPFEQAPEVLNRAFDRTGGIDESSLETMSEQEREQIVTLTMPKGYRLYARRKPYRPILRLAKPSKLDLSEHLSDEQFLTKKRSC